MRLAELLAELARHGVSLKATPEGKLRPRADQPPPAELVEAMRQHRAALLRQVEEGRLPDGRLDITRLTAAPGHCGSCARWTPTPYTLEGECSAGRRAHGWYDGNPSAPVLIHPGHRCAADSGQGYRARGAA